MSGAAVRIDGELTIYRAAELKADVLAAPALDLGGVTEIDTAGIQLLLLAQREARAAGRGWRIADASPAVDDALALLGLTDGLLAADEA
jgi:anti-sigma B factor antagonist